MRILLSAFACDPLFGSDEEVGWRWCLELARQGHEVTVLTRASHRDAIEAALPGLTGPVPTFEYVDAPSVHALLARFNRRNHLYYYLWQWWAFQRARDLHQARPFDLVHHVTWVSFRQPSFMGRLGIPFVFGPVAGGDEIPSGYTRSFSFKQRLVERARAWLNACVRFDPLMRATFRQATRVIFTSPAHLDRVPAFVRRKSSIELAIGSVAPSSVPRVPGQGTKLLFAGRAIGLKGLDFGLHAFAQARALRPDLTLTVVGDGPELARWKALARELGVWDAVTWHGWLTKQQVQDLYASYDALYYPSFRDSGGFVVLEALQAGLPVVCFRLGGPGVMVDDEVGAAVEAGPDVADTVSRFAQATLRVLDRGQQEPGLSDACRQRAERFTWAALVARVYPGTGVASTEGRA